MFVDMDPNVGQDRLIREGTRKGAKNTEGMPDFVQDGGGLG